MESNFKLNPCTDIEQSKRLLELGIRKETADCGHFYNIDEHLEYRYWSTEILDGNWKSYWDVTDEEIPAWSLGRLVEIINKCTFESFESEKWKKEAKKFCRYVLVSYSDDLIETSIEIIEALIEKGYFNNEYLV